MQNPTTMITHTLIADHERYEQALAVYKKKSGEQTIYEEWYDKVFEDVVVNKLPQDEQKLRILGIGVGSGTL